MLIHHSFGPRLARTLGTSLCVGTALLLTGSPQAHAQGGAQAAKAVTGFLNTGAYFITGSARHAIGDVKFYNAAQFYTRPRVMGGLAFTGGGEIISATDHFFPFGGGDSYNLYGVSGRVSTTQDYHGLKPWATVGAYLGELRSEQLGFDRANFTPSFSVGVDYKISPHFSVTGAYRISQEIHGYNTDGFSIFLKIY